jgi:hypothetical protein
MMLVGNGAFHRRPYQAVLSCADADRDAIDRIYAWLTGVVGMPIGYSEAQVAQESRPVTALADGIGKSRATILVLSHASVQSGKLEEEYNAALVQRRAHPGYRVVAIRLQGAKVPTFMRGTKQVELTDRKLDIRQAAELLACLDGMDHDAPALTARDVYVSRTWRESGASQFS